MIGDIEFFVILLEIPAKYANPILQFLAENEEKSEPEKKTKDK
jgi:hypothetical protein